MAKQIYYLMFRDIGDVLVSTAIINALKIKYPDSEITFATGSECVDVLKHNPQIAHILPVNHQWEGMLRSLEKKYDVICTPLQLTQLDSVWHQQPEWCVEGTNHNLVDFYASRCNQDLTITDRRTFIYPQEEHYTQIYEQMPPEYQERFKNTPFITVHTTSRNPSKDWSYEKFNKLCERIHSTYGDKFVIYQIGKGDKQLDKTHVVQFQDMPLLNTAALIKRSLLHIDGDSGPSFIADSQNVPTIVIFGATHGLTSGPIGPNVIPIEPIRKCIGKLHTPCHQKCITGDNCIEENSVDEVFNTFSKLINGRIK